MIKYLRISSYVRKPSNMTLQLLLSEIPNIWGKFISIFINAVHSQVLMMRIFACCLGLEVEELLTARGRQPRLLRTEQILFQHYAHYNLLHILVSVCKSNCFLR
jgi:hypothetical protein